MRFTDVIVLFVILGVFSPVFAGEITALRKMDAILNSYGKRMIRSVLFLKVFTKLVRGEVFLRLRNGKMFVKKCGSWKVLIGNMFHMEWLMRGS